jgi:uncharacterized protein involved in propanediol utilization
MPKGCATWEMLAGPRANRTRIDLRVRSEIASATLLSSSSDILAVAY